MEAVRHGKDLLREGMSIKSKTHSSTLQTTLQLERCFQRAHVQENYVDQMEWSEKAQKDIFGTKTLSLTEFVGMCFVGGAFIREWILRLLCAALPSQMVRFRLELSR